MKYDVKPGKKGKDDLILLICTESWEQLTYKDLFTMVKHFYDNEDKIYPPPKFKGSKKLLEALEYLRTHTISETLLKFQLREAEKVHDFMLD